MISVSACRRVCLTVAVSLLAPAAVSAQKLVTAPGAGAPPSVRVVDASGTDQSFFAYDPAFLGGVRVALGDVNGDGVLDIITGAGPGGGPHGRIWDGATLTELHGFFAYDPTFAGGVFVAAGDVNGDGRADIITGAGPGGGPHVRIWDGATFSEIAGFFAYNPFFPGGVNVAAGDVDGDGLADIITGAGPGGGPHVRVWSGATLAEIGGLFAYDPAYPGGVIVGMTDLDRDGQNEIVTGPMNGLAIVRLWTGTTFSLFGEYLAFDPSAGGSGVFIASVAENPGTGPRFTSANETTFTVGSAGTF